jgi:hypothetical protein
MSDDMPSSAQPSTPDGTLNTVLAPPLTLMVGVLSREIVNTSWADYALRKSRSVGEQVQYDRMVEGSIWRVGTLSLGIPRVTYSEEHITIKNAIVKDSQFAFRSVLGRAGRRVHEMLEALPASSTAFTVKVPLANGYLRYNSLEGAFLRLQWSGEALFEHAGGDYNWAALTEHYKETARVNLYKLLPPISPLLHDVKCSFTLREGSLDLNLLTGSAGFALGDTNSLVVPSAAGDACVLSFLSVLFPEVLLGLPPADNAWLAGFCAPPGSLRFTAGQPIPDLLMYWALYDASSVADQSRHQAHVEQPLAITPRLRLVGVSDEKQALTLAPASANVQWSFEGAALGRLVNEKGEMFYYPPSSNGTAFALDSNNKTKSEVALQTGARPLISADVIKATAGSETATSTFVTLHTRESHYLKAQRVNNKVRLVLFYESFEGEVEVRAADTRWTVIIGNGTMSATGIFTPHPTEPSPFTVLLAEDTQDQARFHYWASIVIPVPTLTAARFVELTNG